MKHLRNIWKILWNIVPWNIIVGDIWEKRSFLFEVIGGEVQVDIFDDRLEIYSPGGMADGTMIQDRNIDYVPSERRNPLLADW